MNGNGKSIKTIWPLLADETNNTSTPSTHLVTSDQTDDKHAYSCWH